MSAIGRFGVVVIGRNEGQRLRRCLESVVNRAKIVVYVDSGSTDGSVARAEDLGAVTVRLDLKLPFTAARARNEGFHRMCELAPELDYVQFVDGDCEVAEGWLDSAVAALDSNPPVVAVCGRRRERFPEQSVYNLLCDIEWDTAVGEVKTCGGDVMMRTRALSAAGGYRSDLIAGEEPELCVRLRAAGWSIRRLGEEMTLHDAAMTQFSQWWKRMLRGGYAMAEGVHLHGSPPERHRVRDSISAWFWGFCLPILGLSSAVVFGAPGLLPIALYPLQVLRLGLRGGRGSWWRALFLVIGKFPEMLGQLKFLQDHYFDRRPQLIEYK